ncbi:MAG: alpha/beta fold hydrolase [Dehalococcoidia bacterium]
MERQYVTLRDGRMAYLHQGQGFPILLLHSLGVSSWAWEGIMEPLSQQFSVYALDMLGHGDSDKPQRDFTIADFGATVCEFMDAQGLQRVHLVGNSVGATLSVEVATTQPHRVDKVVLVGCPAWTRQEAEERLQDTRAQYDAQGMPLPRTLENLQGTFDQPTPKLQRKVNELRSIAGPWVLKTMQAISRHDLMQRLPALKAPTLVVYGEVDYVRSKEDTLMRALPGARKVILFGAGHLPQVQKPQEFAQAVVMFLADSD